MNPSSVPENPLPKVRPTFHNPIIFGSCDDFVWWNARGFGRSVMATKRYGQKEGAVLWLTFRFLDEFMNSILLVNQGSCWSVYINKDKENGHGDSCHVSFNIEQVNLIIELNSLWTQLQSQVKKWRNTESISIYPQTIWCNQHQPHLPQILLAIKLKLYLRTPQVLIHLRTSEVHPLVSWLGFFINFRTKGNKIGAENGLTPGLLYASDSSFVTWLHSIFF